MKKTMKARRPTFPIQQNPSAKVRAILSMLAALFILTTAVDSAKAEVEISHEISEEAFVLRVRKDLGAPIDFAAVDQTFGGNVINTCVTDNAPPTMDAPCSMIDGEGLKISLRISSGDVLKLRVEVPLIINIPAPPGPPSLPPPIPPPPLLSPPMPLVCLPVFGVRLRVNGDPNPIVIVPEVTDCSFIALPEG